MMVIGITGGSGAGKSSACRFLVSRGGMLIDCDKVYASLVDEPSNCTKALADVFGAQILMENGALDRAKLSELVFGSSNKDRLKALNETVHPIVIAEVQRIINCNPDTPYFLIDAPQLFEAKADELCDCTVYVTAKKEIRIKRIIDRDGISPQAAIRRVESQLSDGYFKERCSYIIKNDGTEQELMKECINLLDTLGIH